MIELVAAREPMVRRLWAYQRERFPLSLHGVLIAAMSFSSVAFSRLLRGETGLPGTRVAVVAFGSALLLFVHLRIADEYKDRDDDVRYRPHLPVPRGLVTLGELGAVGAVALVVEAVLALWLDAAMLLLLVAIWAFMALMTREFFVADWLRRRPAAYMLSHMVVLPIVVFYVTAADWLPARKVPPAGLTYLLLATFFIGITLEVGRKISSPEEERPGYQTYSHAWGMRRAVVVWMGSLLAAGTAAVAGGRLIDFGLPMAAVTGAVVVIAALLGRSFLRARTPRHGELIELASGAAALALYVTMGTIPLLVRLAQRAS